MRSLTTRFLLPFGLLAVLISVFVLYQTYTASRQHANELIRQQLDLALDFDLAIRDYAADKVRPAMENLLGKDGFKPETMSSSYISRSIFEQVRRKFPDYIIRFSSDNPRNPANMANADERKIIQYFRDHPLIEKRTEEVEIDGRRYLAHFTPKRMKSGCLRCHGNPADAPAELLKRYGATGSFHRKVGDVAGLDTIAAPIDKINAALANDMRRQSLIFVTGLALLFGLIMVAFHLVVTRRLSAMSAHFQEIASLPESQGMTPVRATGRDEIGILGSAFNKLIERLRTSHALFEEHVMQRTAELQQANEALRESEARYRELFEAESDAIFLIDNETGSILQANSAAVALYGYDRDELLTKKNADLSAEPEETQQVTHGMPIIPDQVVTIPLRLHRKKDGTVMPVEITGRFFMREGRPVHLAAIGDITERKRAEEALRISEEQYRQLFENMTEGVALHELIYNENGQAVDYRIVDTNPAFNRHTGLSPERLHGLPASEIFETNIPPYLEEYERVTRTREPIAFETFFPPMKKHFRIAVVSPKPGFFATVFEDITDRKRSDEEKGRLQSQLFQSQKMESIGRLAGGVAHDFNNMLGVIIGHAEIAIHKVDKGLPLLADLKEILKAAQRSADITRQLLAYARKQTIAPKVLDMNDTVAGMLKMLQRIIGEDIHLAWLPGVNLRPVKIDPSQLDQILANLCVNARDAIAGPGKLTIETRNIAFDEVYCADHPGAVPGEYVLLTVSDNGCGMDKETLGKLFEPFFTTKDVGKGTGLGLATIYGIVKQNSGFINVYSEPGQGTTFSIYLPRYIGKGEQVEMDGMPEADMSGRETVLVVEDEPALLDLSKLMLEKQGYQVLTAGTPGEAIRLAEEHAGEIHLLLTDVVMPEMNGRELAEKMLSLYPDLKRLFMSGYTADVIAHHGVLDDGVCFIQKPFSIKDLAAKVREALDQE